MSKRRKTRQSEQRIASLTMELVRVTDGYHLNIRTNDHDLRTVVYGDQTPLPVMMVDFWRAVERVVPD